MAEGFDELEEGVGLVEDARGIAAGGIDRIAAGAAELGAADTLDEVAGAISA
jgi:hypothetical protein